MSGSSLSCSCTFIPESFKRNTADPTALAMAPRVLAGFLPVVLANFPCTTQTLRPGKTTLSMQRGDGLPKRRVLVPGTNFKRGRKAEEQVSCKP
jgi:hypothetical protein